MTCTARRLEFACDGQPLKTIGLRSNEPATCRKLLDLSGTVDILSRPSGLVVLRKSLKRKRVESHGAARVAVAKHRSKHFSHSGRQ